MTTLLTSEHVRDLFHYKSRSAFHEFFAKDRELQRCAVRIGGRVLFDQARLEKYIRQRSFVKDSNGPHL